VARAAVATSRRLRKRAEEVLRSLVRLRRRRATDLMSAPELLVPLQIAGVGCQERNRDALTT
jgi:hypothetical protein